MSDKQQEELAALLSRTLTFGQSIETPSTPLQASPQQAVGQIQQQSSTNQPISYISQHCHHSSHVVPKATSEQPHRRIELFDLQAVLLRNNIDPSSLFPSQVELFQNADDDQRLRLLELWRISPPSYGGHALAQELGTWPETTIHQEEAMAKLRYERQELERQRRDEANTPQSEESMEDTGPMEAVAALAVSPTAAEPYILSGYESLARRDYKQQAAGLQRTSRDNGVTGLARQSAGLWDKRGLQDMENQYGAFEQMREYGAPPAHMQHFVGIHGLDEDMVM